MTNIVERVEERAAVNRDAVRYRFLRDLPAIKAQAYFWNYTSRRERDAAIDRDIEASLYPPQQRGRENG